MSFREGKKIGLLRLDSGFYADDIFSHLEDKQRPIDYITAVPMYATIQRKIAAQRTWLVLDYGIEIAEFDYQGQDWLDSRRMIAVRLLLSNSQAIS